nr:hypothetical protein [uncultured Campylobacter sp.]
MKFLEFLGARCFDLRAAERKFEILKFLNARHFGSHKQAAELLKFAPEPSRNGFRILNFTPKLRNGLEILKFTRISALFADTAQNFISQREFEILKLICEPPRASRRTLPRADKAEAGRVARLTSQHTHDATEKRRAVKFNHAGGYSNFVRRRIARLRSAAARHGYEVGRAEKLSKFDLMGALLNFIYLPPRKFKLALLKFASEVPRNRSEILKFTLARRKFKLAPRKSKSTLRKFKPASAVRLNFALNSVLRASASKFENGVKFKGAAKFERSAR